MCSPREGSPPEISSRPSTALQPLRPPLALRPALAPHGGMPAPAHTGSSHAAPPMVAEPSTPVAGAAAAGAAPQPPPAPKRHAQPLPPPPAMPLEVLEALHGPGGRPAAVPGLLGRGAASGLGEQESGTEGDMAPALRQAFDWLLKIEEERCG